MHMEGILSKALESCSEATHAELLVLAPPVDDGKRGLQYDVGATEFERRLRESLTKGSRNRITSKDVLSCYGDLRLVQSLLHDGSNVCERWTLVAHDIHVQEHQILLLWKREPVSVQQFPSTVNVDARYERQLVAVPQGRSGIMEVFEAQRFEDGRQQRFRVSHVLRRKKSTGP
jgi:hypothetical protein